MEFSILCDSLIRKSDPYPILQTHETSSTIKERKVFENLKIAKNYDQAYKLEICKKL
ncbi:MAG: hypothetical protein Q8942_17920 [Bacillota bacterium]|nr:hypothetical protein [Bacillota bacterium]